MCFWFGLEILRLVYKKVFFEYWTVSISFDLLSFEKSSAAPYKCWKKISLKLGVQGIKRNGILRWFQKCAEVSSLVSKKFFSTLIRDGAVFLEVKSSNKIETDQYFKKRFF